jgi:hypothetical protein
MFAKSAPDNTLKPIAGVDTEKSQLRIPEMAIIKKQQTNGSWISKKLLESFYSKKDINDLDKYLVSTLNKNAEN